MSLYRRHDVHPEWEPIPWRMKGERAAAQELGFHQRAVKPIVWTRLPWERFPPQGVFGHDRDWFLSKDVAFHATHDGEDLILIQHPWHGFPDPPEWGLASRPVGQIGAAWSLWGHFPNLPVPWVMPEET